MFHAYTQQRHTREKKKLEDGIGGDFDSDAYRRLLSPRLSPFVIVYRDEKRKGKGG